MTQVKMIGGKEVCKLCWSLSRGLAKAADLVAEPAEPERRIGTILRTGKIG